MARGYGIKPCRSAYFLFRFLLHLVAAESLRTAIQTHGSIDSMLENELGIGEKEKNKLRKKFLVKK
ncbi:tyrosine-protein phosphatase [Belliella sp. R4-6]|uniref:Tyrosine-protein phosphatase n=1 Tax=Belliella alkalica TaxID=1730871 RepID=A0ABS9VHI2_9BACT|nr:tyrosine-protein phosphatase [Belliella alkalica]MCH7415435.1 tyrosine-protein phosphatase [Belliella alkalica]